MSRSTVDAGTPNGVARRTLKRTVEQILHTMTEQKQKQEDSEQEEECVVCGTGVDSPEELEEKLKEKQDD
nr:MAG: hypothetical protein J07AB56_05620 [Candidatus Nanosalinarum sp. J07AB56]